MRDSERDKATELPSRGAPRRCKLCFAVLVMCKPSAANRVSTQLRAAVVLLTAKRRRYSSSLRQALCWCRAEAEGLAQAAELAPLSHEQHAPGPHLQAGAPAAGAPPTPCLMCSYMTQTGAACLVSQASKPFHCSSKLRQALWQDFLPQDLRWCTAALQQRGRSSAAQTYKLLARVSDSGAHGRRRCPLRCQASGPAWSASPRTCPSTPTHAQLLGRTSSCPRIGLRSARHPT